jgi:hypothetical protein
MTAYTCEFLIQKVGYGESVTYVVLEGDESLDDKIRNDGHSYRGRAADPIGSMPGESYCELRARCQRRAQELDAQL